MASVDERRRAAVSCDECRSRKVKCVKLSNDSCQRCVKIGRVCTTSKVKCSRPYYQTSKEQFELMTTVVRHFLPNVSLGKDELREAVASLGLREGQQCLQNMPQSGPLEGHEKRREAHSRVGRKRRANGREHGRKWKRRLGVARGVFKSVEVEEAYEGREQEGTDGEGEANKEEVENGRDGNNDEEEIEDRWNGSNDEEEEGVVNNNGGVEFRDFHQGQLGDSRGLGRVGKESRQYKTDQGAKQPPPECGTGHSQTVALLSPPYTDSPCSSTSDDNMVVDDAMQIPRFYNGSCYGTFYAKISTNLAFTHRRLLRAQPLLNNQLLIDGNTVEAVYPHNLPARQQVESAAAQFFAEVNNVTYVLNYKQFQSDLDNIYSYSLPSTNASLAIVYLILSLAQDSNQFYSEACWYSTAALEEGTLESVQALMLMALCRLNRNQQNLAWVTVGSALRISQSIGLHMHESNWKEKSSFQIECKKRLWWSLYDLESTLSCTLGRPPGIDEHMCRVSTPSDTEFDMNPYTPPGYTEASTSLGKLFSRSIRYIYHRSPASVQPDIVIEELLGNLQEWWNDLPAWLKPTCSPPPSHLRAISYLNLRYYHILIHLTQPYLLHSVTDQASCTPDMMRKVRTCENANTQAILLVRDLHYQKLISNVNFFDALHVLGNGAVLFLRCLRNPSLELMEEVEKYLPVVSLMDHLTIGKFGLRSMQGLLQDLRNFCDSECNQSSSTEDVEVPIVDFNLEPTMFDCWEPSLGWQERLSEMDTISNFMFSTI